MDNSLSNTALQHDQCRDEQTMVFEEKLTPIIKIEKFSATKIGSQDVFEQSLGNEDDFPRDPVGSPSSSEPSLQETFLMQSTLSNFREGASVVGEVLRIEKEGVLVDVGYKSDGLIPMGETNCDSQKDLESFYTPGKKINMKILKLESRSGFILLSKKMADYDAGLNIVAQAFSDKTILEAKVESAVRGGLIVTICDHRGFLPASQIFKDKNDALDSFVGKKMPVYVIDFDKIRNKIIVSNKNVVKQNKKEIKDNALDSIEAGMVLKGKVTSIKSFGAFVDLGGVEGLIHISELSWCRVSNPEEVVKVGQEVDVFILRVDREGRKVSLGYKQLFQDPWVTVEDVYKVGDVLSGVVTKIVSFGAFVELEKGLEGLVHLSEISDTPVTRVEDVLRIGERVNVKVLRIVPEEKKIGLSINAAKLANENHDEQPREYTDTSVPATIGDFIDFSDLKVTTLPDDADDKLVQEVMQEVGLKKSDYPLMDDVLQF